MLKILLGNESVLLYIRVAMPEAAINPHHFDFDLDQGIRAQVVEKLPKASVKTGLSTATIGIPL